MKLRHDAEIEEEALEQVTRSLESLDLAECWLVLFDLRSTAPWSQRLYQRTEAVGTRRGHLVGC